MTYAPLASTAGASASPASGRRRLTAAGLAEEELRAMILGGHLVPGERLNEVVLADHLGISRGPLREAVQRLASEGLLRVVPHKGAYVRTLTEAELNDLYELRIAIETHAVRLGARRGTPAQHDQLRALLERTRSVLKAGNEPHYPADLDVHEHIASLAHNDALLRAMRDAHAGIHIARARSAYKPDRARTALREHEEIVEHVIARHGDEAARLLERHLEHSRDNALTLLRQTRK
jgi:DNA-binding GntR family transcriptional regulator